MSANTPSAPIKLYRAALSGHAHRVELALSFLKLPYELIDVDLAKGEHKQPAFLAKNPFGQIPVIEDSGVTVYDSNAILVYLASRYGGDAWFPRDAIGAAQIQRWFSLAAGPIRYGPGEARLCAVFGAKSDPNHAKAIGTLLFGLLDAELEGKAFALGDLPSLADVAGYSYIAKAPEGGISLEPYPSIRAWLKRIEDLPGFVPFQPAGQMLPAR
jgi:glutathione S-transferase